MKLKYEGTTYEPIKGRSKYQPNGIPCRVTKRNRKHVKILSSIPKDFAPFTNNVNFFDIKP